MHQGDPAHGWLIRAVLNDPPNLNKFIGLGGLDNVIKLRTRSKDLVLNFAVSAKNVILSPEKVSAFAVPDPEAYMGILIPSYLTAYFTFIKIMIQ